MPYTCRDTVGKALQLSLFPIGSKIFSQIFPLHTANEYISRHGRKRAQQASNFIWPFPKKSPLLSKFFISNVNVIFVTFGWYCIFF